MVCLRYISEFSIMARVIGLISWLLDSASSCDVPFTNLGSCNTFIIVLPKRTVVFLCSLFPSSLPQRWRFTVCTSWLQCKTWWLHCWQRYFLHYSLLEYCTTCLKWLETKRNNTSTVNWSIVGAHSLMSKSFSLMGFKLVSTKDTD